MSWQSLATGFACTAAADPSGPLVLARPGGGLFRDIEIPSLARFPPPWFRGSIEPLIARPKTPHGTHCT